MKVANLGPQRNLTSSYSQPCNLFPLKLGTLGGIRQTYFDRLLLHNNPLQDSTPGAMIFASVGTVCHRHLSYGLSIFGILSGMPLRHTLGIIDHTNVADIAIT
jgi:hypothetical protein